MTEDFRAYKSAWERWSDLLAELPASAVADDQARRRLTAITVLLTNPSKIVSMDLDQAEEHASLSCSAP